MTTTDKGIYYPDAADPVAPLQTVFANLAQSVDAQLPLSGTHSFSFTVAAGSSQSVPVNNVWSLAAAPQQVQLTVRGAGGFAATVTTTSATGFTANVHRLNGTGTVTINLVWSVMD